MAVVANSSISIGKIKSGKDGAPGRDGSNYYTWIKYADTPTSGMSDSPEGKAYIGLAYNKPTSQESTNYGDYEWAKVKGEAGVPGKDGTTKFTWVKYANSASGDGMTDSPDGKAYIGLAYNNDTPVESTNASDYTWALFRGQDGAPGTPGAPGKDGTSVRVTNTNVQYAISTSATDTPKNWSDNVPTPEPGKFMWTKTTLSFSDGTSTVSYSVAFSGRNGSEDVTGIISSPTAPVSPKEGTFWSDTSTTPNVLKVYRNGKWEIYLLAVDNLAANSVTAEKLSANAVKLRSLDLNDVSYALSTSDMNILKNTSYVPISNSNNSLEGWTASYGTLTVNPSGLANVNTISAQVQTGKDLVITNSLWNKLESVNSYVLSIWVKSSTPVTLTVNNLDSIINGQNPATTVGTGMWENLNFKVFFTTNVTDKLSISLISKSTTIVELGKFMLTKRNTSLDGAWNVAPEDNIAGSAQLTNQVTQSFKANSGVLQSIITNMTNGYTSSFKQDSSGTINEITRGTDLLTAINSTPDGVYIKGGKILLDGTVKVSGDFYALGGNFTNLNADNITSGKVKTKYLETDVIVAQGLQTANATIGNTLTMGSSGTITTSYTKSNSFNDFRDVSINYTLTGGYNLNSNGLIFSGNTNVTNIGGGVIPLGSKGFTPVSWDAKTIIDESTITMTASNAKGKGVGTGVTNEIVDMPTATLKISPYYLTFSDSATLNSTNVYSGGIRTNELYSLKYTSLMNVDIFGALTISPRTRTVTNQYGTWTVTRVASLVTLQAHMTRTVPRGIGIGDIAPSGYRPSMPANPLPWIQGWNHGIVAMNQDGSLYTGGDDITNDAYIAGVWYTKDGYPTA